MTDGLLPADPPRADRARPSGAPILDEGVGVVASLGHETLETLDRLLQGSCGTSAVFPGTRGSDRSAAETANGVGLHGPGAAGRPDSAAPRPLLRARPDGPSRCCCRGDRARRGSPLSASRASNRHQMHRRRRLSIMWCRFPASRLGDARPLSNHAAGRMPTSPARAARVRRPPKSERGPSGKGILEGTGSVPHLRVSSRSSSRRILARRSDEQWGGRPSTASIVTLSRVLKTAVRTASRNELDASGNRAGADVGDVIPSA